MYVCMYIMLRQALENVCKQMIYELPYIFACMCKEASRKKLLVACVIINLFTNM